MSIIFCGDTVLPFDTTVDYSEIKHLFSGKIAIANLEGSIIKDRNKLRENKWNDKYSLYSCLKILNVLKDLNIKFVSLCNNHILDYKIPIQETEELLRKNDIEYFGLKNHDVLCTRLNGKPLYIITFSTCVNGHALNLYNPDKIINDIKEIKEREDCYIVLFPHWGIERLPYVEPADREHAHRCIDAGADLIIGHHPHIIQQVERYKEKTIVYSIGNFIFPQTYYGDKKLIFDNPAIQKELIVEWDGENVSFYMLYYDAIENIIKYIENTDKNLTVIPVEITNKSYKEFFKAKTSKKTYYISRRRKDSFRSEFFCFLRKCIFRYIRRMLIIIRIHTPK